MTFLSRKADYALLILSYLRQNKAGGSAREIAQQFELSRPFVANILKELGGAGMVTSSRGVNGGYTLTAGALETTLDRLLEAIHEGFRLTVCSDPDAAEEACGLESTCPVRGPLAEIHRRIAAVLAGVTLQDILSGLAVPAGEPTLLPLRILRPQPESGETTRPSV